MSLVSWVSSSSVLVTINGLPVNIPAAVTLERNEGGVRLYLDSSKTINNLPSGNYKTAIIPVLYNGQHYNPQATEVTFYLAENQTIELTVNYALDNTVVRNPAVIQTAIANSLPIHAVQGNLQPNQTPSNIQQPYTQQPYIQQPLTQQDAVERSYFSDNSSTGIAGVRPLPFALGPLGQLSQIDQFGNNGFVSSPVNPAIPATPPNYSYPLQNPVNQAPVYQQPATSLPFQLPPFSSLFSNFGSYEWQATQRPVQQPVITQQQPNTNNTIQQPIQQPIAPPIQTQPNTPNTYNYTRPNPLIPQPTTPLNNSSPSTNTINGKVWQDNNRNRNFEPYEATVEGMRIYLDTNNNNQLDSNEPNTLSNPSGIYEFNNLAAGTYKVSQEMPVGWTNLYAGPAQQLGYAPQVVGGWDASINEFPFMTALVLNQTITTNNGKRFTAGTRWCGATLISSRWLITAAHCVHPNQNNLGFTLRPDMIGVVSNQDYIPDQGVNPNTLIGVRQVITHPSFQAATYRNDIALLELTQALPQSRALLPNRRTSQQLTQVGNSGTVLGWGSTTAPANAGMAAAPMQFPNQLQQTSLPFIDNNRCKQLLAGIFISSDMICAGLPQGGRDACLGDSGGPLLTKVQNSWVLVGIVSFGAGCAEAGKPGVYTNLGNYYDNFVNRYVLPENSQSFPVTFSPSANGQQQSVYFANFR